MRTKSLLLAGTVLFGALPFSAQANTTVEAPADVAAAAPVAAPVAEDQSTQDGLTEIVVTATKRETNLQKTPISIAVMNDEEIKKRHVQSLGDLGDGAIPSLRVATFESRQSALTVGMRGIVPGDANQPAREQGVGVYIDGIYLGRQHGLNAGLLDVERIEVLKGPQGTLFGRNTEGGAVNIVSRAPTGEFGGRVSAGFGNYGAYNSQVHLDLPEFAGISFKLDGAIQHQEATTKNPMEGQEGWNSFHRYGGRISARVRPVDGLTADFAVDLGRDENTPIYSQLINYNPRNLPIGHYVPQTTDGVTKYVLTSNGAKCDDKNRCIAPLPSIVGVHPERQKVADIGVPQQPSVGKTFGVSSIIKYKVAPSLELRSITAWRTVNDAQWDNSGGANRTPAFAPNGTFSRYSLSKLDQRQFSQEFQAVGGFSDIDYVLGLYYFNERANDEAKTPNTNKWNLDGTAYSIVDPLTYPLATVARASIAYAKSYAAYGQATWTPSSFDNFHLTLGGRWTKDKKHGDLYIINGKPADFSFVQENSRFDPLITAAFEPTDGVHLYAKYATGYRAGGASSRSLNYRSFDPESVKSYELGLKSEMFDRKVRFNLAGYIMNRKDSQVDFNFYILDPQTNNVRNTLETVNAGGTTKIRGIEADLTVNPVQGLTLGASYAYTHVDMPLARNTVQEAENAKRNPPITGEVWQKVFIVYTPKHALSGNIDYEVPIGSGDTAVQFHLDANYSSPAYSFDNEDVKAEKSFIVNGRLSLANIVMNDTTGLTISAWARNLFNEQHIYRRSNANGAVLGDYANFNTPRTMGLEATLKF